MQKFLGNLFIFIGLLLYTAQAYNGLRIYHSSFNKLTGYTRANLMPSIIALRKTCVYFNQLKPSRFIGTHFFHLYVGDFQPACSHVWQISNNTQARNFYKEYFRVYRVHGQGTFTGYYEIVVRGSLFKTSEYHYPVYMLPKKNTHITRAEIQNGALKNQNLALVYIQNPYDLYLLQLQGSGQIILPSGEVISLKYAGSNGKPFISISSYLLKNGFQKKNLTIEKVRIWLSKKSDHGASLIAHNPRYIFFNMGNIKLGPVGAQGVELTPKGSIAVDRYYYPLGLPIWIDVYKSKHKYLRTVAITQDTGAAIRGIVRADVFFGSGAKAGNEAYHLNNQGHFYVFYPHIKERNRKAYYSKQGPAFMKSYLGNSSYKPQPNNLKKGQSYKPQPNILKKGQKNRYEAKLTPISEKHLSTGLSSITPKMNTNYSMKSVQSQSPQSHLQSQSHQTLSPVLAPNSHQISSKTKIKDETGGTGGTLSKISQKIMPKKLPKLKNNQLNDHNKKSLNSPLKNTNLPKNCIMCKATFLPNP